MQSQLIYWDFRVEHKEVPGSILTGDLFFFWNVLLSFVLAFVAYMVNFLKLWENSAVYCV